MELCSRILAEVESGDSGPGVPSPSTLETEGAGELVPLSVMSRSSIANVAGTSLSHPDTAGLMGATLKAPITSSPQMLRSIGAVLNPDAIADIETSFGTEVGSEVQPTQPPRPLLHVDIPSGYPDTSGAIWAIAIRQT